MSILCSELLFNYLSESEEIMMSNNSINFISSGNIRKAIEKNNYDKVISFIKLMTQIIDLVMLILWK